MAAGSTAVAGVRHGHEPAGDTSSQDGRLTRRLKVDLVAAWTADQPDVVHAHGWMSGLAAFHAAQEVAVPIVQSLDALGTVERRHGGGAGRSVSGRIQAERHLVGVVDRTIATCAAELLAMGASSPDYPFPADEVRAVTAVMGRPSSVHRAPPVARLMWDHPHSGYPFPRCGPRFPSPPRRGRPCLTRGSTGTVAGGPGNRRRDDG